MPDSTQLPLFPLKAVAFPGGLLSFRVFDARYLALIAQCLRESQSLGVIATCTTTAHDHQQAAPQTERVGVRAELIKTDAQHLGVLHVRCRGMERFEVLSTQPQSNGLLTASVQFLPRDKSVSPTSELLESLRALINAIAALKAQGVQPFLSPFRLDDAGWVANRWCELLPIPLAAKQRLMELNDPLIRLKLVDEFLKNKGLINQK